MTRWMVRRWMAQKVHGGDIPERTKVQKAAVSSNNSALGDFSPCDWIFNPWDCDFSPWDCEAPLPHGAHALLGRQNCGGGRRGKWSWKSCGNGLSDAASLGRGKTVNPNRKRRQDGIAASSTERVVLTSKVNRFGKWSTFLENGKPKAANNGNDGQPKQEKTRLKGLKGLKIKPFSHFCSDFQ